MRHPKWFHVWLIGGLAALLATGCDALQGGRAAAEQTTPEPIEVVSSVVSATGEVVPAKYATLSFPISGQVINLVVEEGAFVHAGDAIAELDTTLLDANIIAAEAALAVAKANLTRAQAGPRAEELERAEHDLAAANASVAEVVAARDRARDEATQAEIAAAERDVQAAINGFIRARNDYDQAIGYAFDTSPERELAERDDLAAPEDVQEDMRQALEAAELNLEAAQAFLDDLLDGPNPDNLRIAEARVWAAAAQRDAAIAYLNLLRAGPSPEDIAVTQAQVEQAEEALESALVKRSQATLKAPFDGTVSTLYVRGSEWVGPGQPILLLADLSSLRVETTDLNEIDAAQVDVGDAAIVQFDALPDVEVRGEVIRISPKSAEGAGVNYTAVIELREIPPALRWGMTAFVDFTTGHF